MPKHIITEQRRGKGGLISVLAKLSILTVDTIILIKFRFHQQDNFLTIGAIINFEIKKKLAPWIEFNSSNDLCSDL